MTSHWTRTWRPILVSWRLRVEHLLGGGYLFRLAFARGAPFLETANDDEKRRHEQHRKASRGEHAAEHRDADRLARIGPGPGCEHQRQPAPHNPTPTHEQVADTRTPPP